MRERMRLECNGSSLPYLELFQVLFYLVFSSIRHATYGRKRVMVEKAIVSLTITRLSAIVLHRPSLFSKVYF